MVIKTVKHADVIDAIQNAKRLAAEDEDGVGTVHVNYCDRNLTVHYKLYLTNFSQIAGPPRLHLWILDWTGMRPIDVPKNVTREFIGQE